jgi:hypothetical protein
MRRASGLLFAFTFLLVTQLNSINSSAQTALVKALNAAPESNVSPSSKEDVPLTTEAVSLPPLEESKNPLATPWVAVPSALSSREPKKFGLIDLAYLDAFTILNDDNGCSRLFGGKFAIAALNEFVLRLKPTYLEHNVAMRMSGNTTTMQSNKTGFTFRVFDKAELNLEGSFFRNTTHSSIVSDFRPNSRETRVVVLLHELGHLVKSADNHWLLPDDGLDRSLSVANSKTVVSACRQQIANLSKLSAEEDLKLATGKPLESLAPDIP